MRLAHDFYVAACCEELRAAKPGNVHAYAGGHGMGVQDFQISAEVSAPFLCERGTPLGQRIRNAVAATREAVGQNTNLGIILLCAPLALAHERGSTVEVVIGESDLADAQAVFDAIQIARPGGLGTVHEHDVHGPARVKLADAMRAAASRDMIARQWTNGFADVLGPGLCTYRTTRNTWPNTAWPATAAYLFYLSNALDSHVQRKWGIDAAVALQQPARIFYDRLIAAVDPFVVLPDLLSWDAQLKADGINPGTSADLTVATGFADRLRLLPMQNCLPCAFDGG